MSKFRIQMLAVCASGLLVLGIVAQASSQARKMGSQKMAVESGTSVGTAMGKYEDVSQIMRQVFTAGDRGPNSPAVKHAADVDMPAQGGTPQKLLVYLRNATVHKWYCDNFGLR
jgi:hypothetical protein